MKPTPTSQTVDFSDKTRYDVYSDGSYRRTPPKVKGKANVKRAKRAKSRP